MTAETARGCVLIDPRCCGPNGVDALGIATQAGEDTVSIPLDDWCRVTPSDLEPTLRQPLWHVAFRTAGDASGYSWSWVRDHLEGPRRDGRSWASLLQAYPNVEWILQIGNEPTLDWPQVDAWTHRWWMLACYQELALNAANHVDQAWRNKYPMLKWACAVGTSYDAYRIHVQWSGGSDLGAGGVRDWYDAIACHLYGESSLGDGDLQRVYQELLGDPYTKAIQVTEIGINRADWSPEQKAEQYRTWINRAPAKVEGVHAFIAGSASEWPHYRLDSYRCGQLLGDHFGGL